MDRILAISEPVARVMHLATWLTVAVVGLHPDQLGDRQLDTRPACLPSEACGSSMFTLGFYPHHPNTGCPRRRLHRRRYRIGAGGTADRLPAHHLQLLQPPRDPGHPAREPCRGAGVGSRAPHPPPAGRAHRQPAQPVGRLERWAADVAESHTSYPSLLYLRSPRPQNSWIISLVAVMDAAAIALAIDPEGAPIESRMAVRMGFTCLRDIAQVTRIPFDPDPSPDDPISLPQREFDAGLRATAGDRLSDGSVGRGCLAPLPGLAGELRGRRLRPGRPQRPPGPVDRTTAPVPGRVPGAHPSGRPPTHRQGPARRLIGREPAATPGRVLSAGSTRR